MGKYEIWGQRIKVRMYFYHLLDANLDKGLNLLCSNFSSKTDIKIL